MEGLAGLAPPLREDGLRLLRRPRAILLSVAESQSLATLLKYWLGCCTPLSICTPCTASNVIPHASW